MPSLGSHQKRRNSSFDDMLWRIGCSMEAEFDTSLRLDGVAEDNKLLARFDLCTKRSNLCLGFQTIFDDANDSTGMHSLR